MTAAKGMIKHVSNQGTGGTTPFSPKLSIRGDEIYISIGINNLNGILTKDHEELIPVRGEVPEVDDAGKEHDNGFGFKDGDGFDVEEGTILYRTEYVT